MSTYSVEKISFLALLIAFFTLLFFVFAPLLNVLLLAVVLAILLDAPYQRIKRMFAGSGNIAAFLTVGLTLVFVVVPLFFLGGRIFDEAQGLYTLISGPEVQQYMRSLQGGIQDMLRQTFPGYVFNLNMYVGNAVAYISNNLGSLIYQTLYVLFGTFLMMLALFFFLRDGRALLASFARVSPFGEQVTHKILDTMYRTIHSVMRGTLFILLIRFACLWAAFYVFQIPNTVLWSSVGAIAGAIPGLGTAFAFVGGVVYLALAGHTTAAVVLALVGSGVVALIDNVLTSYFFGKELEVSAIFVLFSILGGILFFGPIGFILGPLVLSVCIALVHIYATESARPSF